MNLDDQNTTSNHLKTEIKREEHEFNSIEIIEDDFLKQIEHEVKELIELLDDNEDDDSPSTAIRYPGLTSKSIKREIEDSGKLFKNYNQYSVDLVIYAVEE